ncbi:MAG: Rieske (2Fe-2S) protein [Verrucomicrobia bacterium]|nr:Rieske (2Fe-2S) protein [Verrucomicrobiota bacterium]MBV8273875.1 Rieske (2Fe-2S) protein [Verrucomicrobiota bacterium]
MNKDIKRRDFLILTASALAGSKMVQANPANERVVDVGPASNYANDGIYAGFENQGFFIVRKGTQLFALSGFCTHRRCKLAAQSDRSFYCKCHGSRFDPNGKVTDGPAKRDLPQLSVAVNDKGNLLVKVTAF